MKKLICSLFLLTGSFLAASEVVQLTPENYEEVINSTKPVVMDVYVDWCGPCKMFAPIFKEVNEEYGDDFIFVKLNAEDPIADNFQIYAFPTIIFLKDKEEIARHVGYMNKQEFEDEIYKAFGS